MIYSRKDSIEGPVTIQDNHKDVSLPPWWHLGSTRSNGRSNL